MTSTDYFDELNKLSKSLTNLDERGLVLSLAAFADDSLSTLLKAYMLDNVATKKLIEGFDAPLGTFSSRIRATYALGLLTKGQYNDFEHLRLIRNMFSHTWESICFSDPKVSKHIYSLNFSNIADNYPETLREKLEGTISFLLVEINAVANQISIKKQRPQALGSRLFSGLTGTSDEQIAKCKEKCEHLKNELISAKEDRRKFFKHIQVCWVEKYLRAISHAPEEKQSEYLLHLMAYTSQEGIRVKNIHHQDQ